MTDDRQGNGRRAGDALFSRGFKIASSIGGLALVAITVAFKIYAQAQDFPAVKDRIAAVEIVQAELKASNAVQLMMTCILFRDAHPNQVPALCDAAISRAVLR